MKRIFYFMFAAIVAASTITTTTSAQASTAKVAPYYKNPKSAYALKMRSTLSALSKGDFNRAWTEYMALGKLIDKSGNRQSCVDALYPLYDLAQAMFEARPAGSETTVALKRDPWQAMTTVRNVYVTGVGIDKANVFLADEEIGLSVDMIRRMVIKQLMTDTKRMGTVEAYSKLIEVLDPSDAGYNEARNQLAALEFDNTCTTAAGCREFLRNYPESPLVGKAKQRAMKFDYDDACKANTSAGWKKFIADYQYVPGAEDRVSQARASLKRVDDARLLSRTVTLAELDAYVASNRRDMDNKIFTVYDNLINLPTHSYRFLSLKLGFGGATGRVEETVVDASGSRFVNRYVFNKQGLLEQVYDGRTKATTRYTYGYDAVKGFYPLSKSVGKKTFKYECTYNTSNGHITKVRCGDGTSMSCSYDATGRLTGRVEIDGKGRRHVSSYRSGKIRSETTGDVSLKFVKYDGAFPTQIVSQNRGKTYVWTYEYTLNGNGLWTRASARLDGKPRLTITRAYSE